MCFGGRTMEKIEVRGRQGRRTRQLPYALDERRWYWELKYDTLDGTVWSRFRRGCGPVVRKTAE